MNRIISTLTALTLSAFLTHPTLAEDSIEYAVKPNRGLSMMQHNRLDTLFDALRDAKSEVEALGHEREIWRIWTAPKDETLGKLMDTAINKLHKSDYKASLEVLNKVTERFPKYAEGWNQRAVAHFYLNNYEASVDDIAKTLTLEPRHFGALSGRGFIRLEQGLTDLAEQDILRAMRYHPYVQSRALLQSISLIKVSDLPYI